MRYLHFFRTCHKGVRIAPDCCFCKKKGCFLCFFYFICLIISTFANQKECRFLIAVSQQESREDEVCILLPITFPYCTRVAIIPAPICLQRYNHYLFAAILNFWYFEIPTFGYCANHENVVTLHRYCNKMTTAICRFSRLQILLYKDIE